MQDDLDGIDKTVIDDLDVSGTQIGDGIRSQDLKPGSMFAGRYEILSEGFRGGMGVVYQCRDIKLQRQKALKIIHPHLLKSSNSLQRFRQEVAISQELQHEHIVRVYDLDEYQGQEFFTMEWVEGKNLRDLIVERKKEGRPFTLEEAYEILSQLNDALQYAHRYTVHRDIKPENILIKEDGDKQTIKLTDFGIAKMLTTSQFTTTSIQMGTPYYMAPEQKLDSGHVDKRADIYSAGVILFELLTLENTIGFDLPSEINRTLPQEIDEVIRQALATKPEKRYAEIRNFSQALLNVAELDRKKQEKEEQIKQAQEKKKREIDELVRRINKELEKKNLSEAEILIASLTRVDREKADEYRNRLARLKDEIKEAAEKEQQRLAAEKKKQEERIRQREIEEQRKKYDTPVAPSQGPSSNSKVKIIIGVIAVTCIVLLFIILFGGHWQSWGPTIEQQNSNSSSQVAAPAPAPAPMPTPVPAPTHAPALIAPAMSTVVDTVETTKQKKMEEAALKMQAQNKKNRAILLATTTFAHDTGLLDKLIPIFEKQTGYFVKTIALGSGQAMMMGEKGEADVLLVHSPDAEKKFIEYGYGINRRLVMHNDFIIVGPVADPAKIKSEKSSAEAMKKIAQTGSLFLSRGDNSITHAKEKTLWKKAAITPAGQKWYQETGLSMGQTLSVAAEKKGYTLTDRGTYLPLKKNIGLDILVEGDAALLNIYHVIEVNSSKWPKANAAGAKAFADFMVSRKTQEIIKTFGVDKYGSPLFFSDAGKKVEDLEK